jgi:hypothetical protein
MGLISRRPAIRPARTVENPEPIVLPVRAAAYVQSFNHTEVNRESADRITVWRDLL